MNVIASIINPHDYIPLENTAALLFTPFQPLNKGNGPYICSKGCFKCDNIEAGSGKCNKDQCKEGFVFDVNELRCNFDPSDTTK